MYACRSTLASETTLLSDQGDRNISFPEATEATEVIGDLGVAVPGLTLATKENESERFRKFRDAACGGRYAGCT